MSIEAVALAAANIALDLIERELREYDERASAAERAAAILRQKLLLRHDAQEDLDRRRAGR
jgi:hypothetical protein